MFDPRSDTPAPMEASEADDVPADAALPDAARAMADVAKNEETRFGNLNTRGVAVLSATSLVTALSGIFAKEFLGTGLSGWGLGVGIWGLAVTVALLTYASFTIVFGVLAPRHRAAFGGNALTDTPSALVDASQVLRVVSSEYRQIARSLLARNSEKAAALEKAYTALFLAICSAAVSVAAILIWRADKASVWPL